VVVEADHQAIAVASDKVGSWQVPEQVPEIMKTVNLALIALIAAGCSQSLRAQPRPLGVCEALNSVADHRTVVIHALMGISHQTYLYEGNGEEPCVGWRRRFLTAPAVIPVLFGSFSWVLVSEKVRRDSIDFVRHLKQLNLSANHMVMVNGVLIRKPWTLSFRGVDGSWAGWGMGLEGGDAALLVLTSAPGEDR
jgi:hypothetical protein